MFVFSRADIDIVLHWYQCHNGDTVSQIVIDQKLLDPHDKWDGFNKT